jgi:hypothetical protein
MFKQGYGLMHNINQNRLLFVDSKSVFAVLFSCLGGSFFVLYQLYLQNSPNYFLNLQWLMLIILENWPIRGSQNWTILKVISLLLHGEEW